MPTYLPYHLPLVYISGVFEIIFGVFLLFPTTQEIGAWGIIATLIGVFPANIHMLKTNRVKKEVVHSGTVAQASTSGPFNLLGLALYLRDESQSES